MSRHRSGERGRIEVIGHRGAAALAPENTWASFDAALAVGVDAIETDVQATSDGVLVLIHDERLERTTNGQGLVRETPWEVIRRLDAGSWFSEQYRGERIPRLDETLDRYGPQTHFVLEIKQVGVEPQAVAMVGERHWLKRVTFTSFDFSIVRRIKQEAPSARVGFLTSRVDAEMIQQVAEADLEQFCPAAEAVSRELVSAWQGRGLEVRAWGVRDTRLMRQAIEAGVDGMTVDFPHLLVQALGREG